MTLTGWTLPQTASGRSASVPPPPWRPARSVPGRVYPTAFSVTGGKTLPLGERR